MARKINISASVGRQRITKSVSATEASYVVGIRQAFARITANYGKLIDGLVNITPDIIMEALEPTFELSQKYCPKDTGKLVESGFLETVGVGKNTRVAIGYAKGGNPHYAVYVHELTHLKHASPTRAKFLLTALEQDAPNIQKRIIVGYKQAMGLS